MGPSSAAAALLRRLPQRLIVAARDASVASRLRAARFAQCIGSPEAGMEFELLINAIIAGLMLGAFYARVTAGI